MTKPTLVDKLKIALGRKLSEAQMTEAHCNSFDKFAHYGNNGSYSDVLFREGDTIKRLEIVRGYTTTPDSSYPKISHTRWYTVEYVNCEYNLEGLLVKKTVSKNEPHGSVYSHKDLVYEPAGSFFGRRVKEKK